MTDLCRGSIALYSERGEYTSKLRPGLIVQRESTLADSPSVTLCGITTFVMPAIASRIMLVPDSENGLDALSFVMIDKIVSISRPRIRAIVGKIDADSMTRVDAALRRWLDL